MFVQVLVREDIYLKLAMLIYVFTKCYKSSHDCFVVYIRVIVKYLILA